MILDHIVFAVYLISLLLIGIYQKAQIKKFKDYGSINKSLQASKLMLIATIFVNSVGGGATFGIAEKVFSNNLSYTYGLLLAIIADILIAIYIVPKITQHYGVISVGDIMYKFYGRIGRVFTGIAAVFVSFGYVAVQISVSSRIFQYMLKISYIEGVILSYVIVILYTSIGGLRSVLFTNLFQFFAIILTIPMIMIIGLYQVGLFDFVEMIPYSKYAINSHFSFQETLLLAFSFALMCLKPGFIQRSFITQNSDQVTKAIITKSFIYGLFVLIISINGLIAYIITPHSSQTLVIPDLINKLIPHGIQGIIVVGFMSSVMSTADSDLNIASISMVNDVIKPLFRIQKLSTLLFLAQASCVCIGTLAIYLALKFTDVIDLVLFIAGFWVPVILAPFILGLYKFIVNKSIFTISSLAGLITFAIWEYNCNCSSNIKGIVIGFTVNLSCLLLGGLLTKRKHMQ